MAIAIFDPAILPVVSAFLFVFALVFGVLNYVKGKDKEPMFSKKVNAILALAIAAFSVMYEPLVEGLMAYLPIAAVILIVLFFIMFLKNAFGGKDDNKGTPFPTIVSLAILLLLLGISYTSLTPYIPSELDPSNVFWGIGVLVAIMFFWMIYKTGD